MLSMSSKCSVYYAPSYSSHKNIERHTGDPIVSWPNPKQWAKVHTSDLMMIIWQSIYIYIYMYVCIYIYMYIYGSIVCCASYHIYIYIYGSIVCCASYQHLTVPWNHIYIHIILASPKRHKTVYTILLYRKSNTTEREVLCKLILSVNVLRNCCQYSYAFFSYTEMMHDVAIDPTQRCGDDFDVKTDLKHLFKIAMISLNVCTISSQEIDM